MNRVVVTGQGSISSLGLTADDTVSAMAAGTVGISSLDIRDVDRLSVKIGAQIHGFNPNDYFSDKQIAQFDRVTQFAMIAADQAMVQSGLELDEELALSSGVILGTAGGGLQTQDDSYRAVFEAKKNRVHPLVVPRLMCNAGASQISIAHGLRGPSYTVSTACSSSNQAMGQAFSMIRSGLSKIMLTGGAESMLCFGGLKAWEGLRIMSCDGCRPFCNTRDGLVQGEGAAVFVFEEYEHAKARGADMLAEVCGFCMSSDAVDIIAPDVNGAARAIGGALKDAKLNPCEVAYINAHGTATTVNDITETAAVRKVFGASADNVLMSSTKSMHGHLMGATGAVELLACIAALRKSLVMPTMGYTTPDPDCDIDCVPNETRELNVGATLSSSFAFGGLNAVIALRQI